jgi:hypothetical protein
MISENALAPANAQCFVHGAMAIELDLACATVLELLKSHNNPPSGPRHDMP